MQPKTTLALLVSISLVLSCRHGQRMKSHDEPVTITGTMTYTRRTALPPNATAKVRLLELPKGDEPIRPIAERTIYSPGQVPIEWDLTYLMSQVESGRNYQLETRIDIEGKTVWTNAEPIAIEPGKKDLRLDVMLTPAPPAK